MNIPLFERSKYYRGLLVLIRKDRAIHEHERELMVQIGNMLDFDKRFCEAAIDELLRNPNITDEPVVFSSKQTAECFILDAIRLVCPSYRVHPHERSWLQSVALANGLTESWLDAQFQKFFEKRSRLELPAVSALEQYL